VDTYRAAMTVLSCEPHLRDLWLASLLRLLRAELQVAQPFPQH